MLALINLYLLLITLQLEFSRLQIEVMLQMLVLNLEAVL